MEELRCPNCNKIVTIADNCGRDLGGVTDLLG